MKDCLTLLFELKRKTDPFKMNSESMLINCFFFFCDCLIIIIIIWVCFWWLWRRLGLVRGVLVDLKYLLTTLVFDLFGNRVNLLSKMTLKRETRVKFEARLRLKQKGVSYCL